MLMMKWKRIQSLVQWKASDLISPVSGTVVEVNEALNDQPELLNQDAFANWIIKVELSDSTELDSLMDAKAYEAICKE